MEDPETVGTENLFSSLLNWTSMTTGQDGSTDTAYHTYPANRPFVNTEYRRSPSRPIISFPESNRDGVLSALRNLQDRMQRLEVERRDAENNLQSLASETEAYKTSLRQRSQSPNAFRSPRRDVHTQDDASTRNGAENTRPKSKELESQLSSAETRCQLLEKQLDYMRKMVHSAEQDRVEAVRKADALQQQHEQERQRLQQQEYTDHNPAPFTPDYCAQFERISELERDHLRLTATQTLAESKIKELENKLKDERDHRRVLQERALDLESAAVSHQILLNSAPPVSDHRDPPDSKGGGGGGGGVRSKPSSKPCCKKPPAAKKKKKLVSRKQAPVRSEPTKHYRLNLADIPFVAGKSAGPSHAVGANVQKVLALMKAHNLALCSSLYNGHSNGNGSCHGRRVRGRSQSPSASSSSSLEDQDLADLLAQLQDEFGQLSCEHQDLLHQIAEEKQPRVREDIEKELDLVLEKMESKGQQISRVRQHQQKQSDERRQEGKPGNKPGGGKQQHVPRPSSALGRMQTSHKYPPPHDCLSVKPQPRGRSKSPRDKYTDCIPPSLNVLRNMKKLQTTLRQDDLSWE